MRRVLGTSLMVMLSMLAAGGAAEAQQVDADAAAPTVNLWYAGVNGGVSVVESAGGVVGGDLGVRLWKNLDGVVDVFWAADVTTRRQIDNVERLVGVLAAGGSAAGSITVPVTYAGVGGRWVFENSGRYRPYVLATVGVARTNLKPKFSVNGTDVTGSVGNYGVTLGEDLAGTYSRFGAEAGVGFVAGFGPLYIDLGARMLSIDAPEQRVNVPRLVIGAGYRF